MKRSQQTKCICHLEKNTHIFGQQINFKYCREWYEQSGAWRPASDSLHQSSLGVAVWHIPMASHSEGVAFNTLRIRRGTPAAPEQVNQVHCAIKWDLVFNYYSLTSLLKWFGCAVKLVVTVSKKAKVNPNKGLWQEDLRSCYCSPHYIKGTPLPASMLNIGIGSKSVKWGMVQYSCNLLG